MLLRTVTVIIDLILFENMQPYFINMKMDIMDSSFPTFCSETYEQIC